MNDDTKNGAPRRERTLRFRVTADEAQEIEGRAVSAGLTISDYLRAAAANHPIRSVYDLRAVVDLGRVNGDLGRVAGLLKLWLGEKRGQGAQPIDVEKMMADFRRLQAELHAVMRAALK